MMDYEPWAEHHKPQRFERTDRSGRWSPIEEPENDAWWAPLLGMVAFAAILAATLVWGTT